MSNEISNERLEEIAHCSDVTRLFAYEQRHMARELLALRKAREGWKLVPVESGWQMLSADGCKEHHNGQHCLHHDNSKRIWSAMLAAAPDYINEHEA